VRCGVLCAESSAVRIYTLCSNRAAYDAVRHHGTIVNDWIRTASPKLVETLRSVMLARIVWNVTEVSDLTGLFDVYRGMIVLGKADRPLAVHMPMPRNDALISRFFLAPVAAV